MPSRRHKRLIKAAERLPRKPRWGRSREGYHQHSRGISRRMKFSESCQPLTVHKMARLATSKWGHLFGTNLGRAAWVPSFWLPRPAGRKNAHLAAPATDSAAFLFRKLERLRVRGVESVLPAWPLRFDAGSEMVTLSTIVRCPRCRSRPTVQSAVALRPGVKYLALRCASCGLVYDAQVPSNPTRPATLAEAKPLAG